MEPVRDQPDVTTADTRGHQRVDQPDTGHGGHQRQVPKALHMRFQAELHQMESIEEAERQLNQLNRLRDVATARNEAVTAANYVQVQIGSDRIRQDQTGSDRIRQDQIGSDRTR